MRYRIKNNNSKMIVAVVMIVSIVLSMFTGIVVVPQKAYAGYGVSNPRVIKDEEGEVKRSTWDCIYFGNYWQNDTNGDGKADQNDSKQPIKWRVLSVNGNEAFIVADKALDCKKYNETYTSVTWETCTLRTWLNGTFHNNAFNAIEQVAIKTTNVINEDSILYGIDGGNDTTDRIFLLSQNEVRNSKYGFNSYFYEMSYTRISDATAYVKANNCVTDSSGNCDWWLRSPGDSSYYAASVHSVGTGTCYYVDDDSSGVRPALNINLSSSAWNYAGTVTAEEGVGIWSNDNDRIKGFTLESTQTSQPGLDVNITGRLQLGDDVDTSSSTLTSEVNSIVWTSNDQSIVTDGSISCSGVNSSDNRSSSLTVSFTPKKEGTVTITGTTSNGLTASCVVTVGNESFTLEKTKDGQLGEDIHITGRLQLNDNVENASSILTSEVNSIVWTSSDTSILNVSDITCKGINNVDGKSSSLMITVKPLKKGKVTLTGTTSNGLTASCEIMVGGCVDIDKVANGSEGNTIAVKGTYTLEDSVEPSEKNLQEAIDALRFESSDVSKAKVLAVDSVPGQDNRSAQLVIWTTLYNAGEATITAKANDGHTSKCDITISADSSDDNKDYEGDYTSEMRDFATNAGTFNILKYLCSDGNFPASNFVAENDVKFGNKLVMTITNTYYRGWDGWKDLIDGSTSVEQAEKIISSLLSSYQVEVEGLSKAKTAQKYAKMLNNAFMDYKKATNLFEVMSNEEIITASHYYDVDNLTRMLYEGKYDEITAPVNQILQQGKVPTKAWNDLMEGFTQSAEVSNTIKEGCKAKIGRLQIGGGLTDIGKALDSISFAQNTLDYLYQLETLLTADEMYCEMLQYISKNCAYSVVQEAADNVYSVINNGVTGIIADISTKAINKGGEKIIDTALDAACKSCLPFEIIKSGFDWGVTLSNTFFKTGSTQELKDSLRSQAFLASSIAGWVLENGAAYMSSIGTEREKELGKEYYYSLYMLWEARKNAEETLRSLLKTTGAEWSANYSGSASVTSCLESYRENIFSDNNMQKLLGISVSCPVDVEVYDKNGTRLLTIKDGKEYSGCENGIYYYSTYNPLSNDYDKYVYYSDDMDYSVKVVGKDMGLVDCFVSSINDEGNISEFYIENIKIDDDTVIDLDKISEDGADYEVINSNGDKTSGSMNDMRTDRIASQSLSLNTTSFEMNIGDKKMITASIEPVNASNQKVVWSSDDNSIAIVNSDGVVTAMSAGTTVITATQGNLVQTCTVTVYANVLDVMKNSQLKCAEGINVTHNSDGSVTLDFTGTSYRGARWYFGEDADNHESIDLSQFGYVVVEGDNQSTAINGHDLNAQFLDAYAVNEGHGGLLEIMTRENIKFPIEYDITSDADVKTVGAFEIYSLGNSNSSLAGPITVKSIKLYKDKETYEKIKDGELEEKEIGWSELLSDNPTASPTITPTTPPTSQTTKPTATAAPVPKPTVRPNPTDKPQTGIDLSGITSLYGTGTVSYDKASNTVTGTGVNGLLIPIGITIPIGSPVDITISGTATASMRSWLSDSNRKRMSDIVNPVDFEKNFTLVAADIENGTKADYIQIKGTAYDTIFDSITITKIIVEYDPASTPPPTTAPTTIPTLKPTAAPTTSPTAKPVSEEEDSVNVIFDKDSGVLSISGNGELTEDIVNSVLTYNDKSNVTEIRFEEGSDITAIGDYALINFKNLTSVTIPSSVKKIGKRAFSSSGIESIIFENDPDKTIVEMLMEYSPNMISNTPLLEKVTTDWYFSELGADGLSSDGRSLVSQIGRIIAKKLIKEGQVKTLRDAYDWLCKNCGYELSAGFHVSYSDGPFLYGNASCNGVCMAMKNLLDELCYSNYRMTGVVNGAYGRLSHAWMMVYNNGGWYIIDPTDTRYGDYSTYLITLDYASRNYNWEWSSNDPSATESFRKKELTDNPLQFELLDDGTYGVCGCDAGAVNISIPTEHNGKKVTTIEDNAFNSCCWLESVDVPEGIVSIGNKAFSYCVVLKEIDLPSTLTKVGKEVFYKCVSLSKANLKKTKLTAINDLFKGCAGLKEILISPLVKNISEELLSYRSGYPIYNMADGSNRIKIVGLEGSYAQSYANSKGYPFESIGSMKTQNITGVDDEYQIVLGEDELKLDAVCDSGEAVSYKSENESIVKVESDGTVTALKEGNAVIKISVDMYGDYLEAEKNIKITVIKPKPVHDESSATPDAQITIVPTITPTAASTANPLPVNTISINTGSIWDKLLTIITFGQYQPEITVTINSSLGDNAKIYYYIDKTGSEQVISIDDLIYEVGPWEKYSGEFVLESQKNVVYARIIDVRDNSIYYICSDGIELKSSETAEPTTNPTLEPATEPSATAIVTPTSVPTAVPTKAPTETPTVEPSAEPQNTPDQATATPYVSPEPEVINKIIINNGKFWDKLLKLITFGKYEPKIMVTITSSIEKDVSIYYYIDVSGNNSVMKTEELDNIKNWEVYNGEFELKDKNNVVYAKIINNESGDLYYICTDGISINEEAKPTASGTVAANPTVVPSNNTAYPSATAAPVQLPTIIPAQNSEDTSKIAKTKKITISSVKCKAKTKIITGKISEKKTTVWIKVGSAKFKKATVSGKSFRLKLSKKLKKKTKITIKVITKNQYTLKKSYKVS